MPFFTFGRNGSIKINITTQLRLRLNEFSLVAFKATSPEPFASPVEKKEFLAGPLSYNRGPYFFFSNRCKAFVSWVFIFGSCLWHFWPCWDYVCPNFISRPPTDLKCSRLSHYDLRLMFMEWLLFETISVPFLDHAMTMLTLVLLPDQLKHINFEDWVNMV